MSPVLSTFKVDRHPGQNGQVMMDDKKVEDLGRLVLLCAFDK
jgi:hypothetical protein